MKSERSRLIALLREYRSVLVGYSGGVDSVLLARVAVEALGAERVLAVTGRSASLPGWMEDTAGEVARRFGIPWLEVDTEELADPRYAANPSNRCYYCKSELWGRLRQVADERGLRVVADGSNADDLSDHRPGARAGEERRVRSPLLDAGLTKAEIRAWSRELGLPTWDQPAAPCLASRIPHGLAVTAERLRQVERAEAGLRRLGFRDFRVRHHDDLARLEIHPAELPAALARLGEIASTVAAAGYPSAALDVEGYRRGALQEGLATTPLVQLGGVQAGPDVEAAGAALGRAGVGAGKVRAAGHQREVAVARPEDRLDAELLQAAAAAASGVRAAGFRYLALSLPVPADG